MQVKKDKDAQTLISKELNATFADLPAPQLQWEEMAEAPVPRLDGAAIQIKNLLYVFAGYGTINYVRIFLWPITCYSPYLLILFVIHFYVPNCFDSKIYTFSSSILYLVLVDLPMFKSFF